MGLLFYMKTPKWFQPSVSAGCMLQVLLGTRVPRWAMLHSPWCRSSALRV